MSKLNLSDLAVDSFVPAPGDGEDEARISATCTTSGDPYQCASYDICNPSHPYQRICM
ncbi:MAG TPA: hypothetical protein VHG91_02525 [Longimicrobium sp.]|nr:hypothetical protein [Longimicrobium sp.]